MEAILYYKVVHERSIMTYIMVHSMRKFADFSKKLGNEPCPVGIHSGLTLLRAKHCASLPRVHQREVVFKHPIKELVE